MFKIFFSRRHCKSLPKNAENFNLKVKNLCHLWNSFWSFKIIFEPKINLSALKELMLRPKNYFWFSDILADLHSHLKTKKRNLQFLPKISSNFEFSDVDIWPIGRKFWPKIFSSSILWPKKIWVEYDHCTSLKCKKTIPPPSNTFEGGGGVWFLLVTYPSNHLTC